MCNVLCKYCWFNKAISIKLHASKKFQILVTKITTFNLFTQGHSTATHHLKTDAHMSRRNACTYFTLAGQLKLCALLGQNPLLLARQEEYLQPGMQMKLCSQAGTKFCYLANRCRQEASRNLKCQCMLLFKTIYCKFFYLEHCLVYHSSSQAQVQGLAFHTRSMPCLVCCTKAIGGLTMPNHLQGSYS